MSARNKGLAPRRESELPRFVRDLLAAPPQRGEGLNLWFYRVARVLHAFRAPEEIGQLLGAATAGQPVQRGEIERAVERSKEAAWQPGIRTETARPESSWPVLNRARRESICRAGAGLVDLWEGSPGRIEDHASHAEEFIDALFPGNPWLCVGASGVDFKTRHREDLRGELAALSLIVPSPMTAQTGKTKEGKESEHTLESTGPRRFLVIEQDSGSADEQAAILLHLAEHAPLVLALHSGGKSIHGWFAAAGRSEERLLPFMRYAVSLGADRALWTRSQFARLPDGTRENGKRQTTYFLNRALIP
jgi:hypothetical protein